MTDDELLELYQKNDCDASSLAPLLDVGESTARRLVQEAKKRLGLPLGRPPKTERKSTPPPSAAVEVERDQYVLFPDIKKPEIDWEAALERHGAIADARHAQNPSVTEGVVDLTAFTTPVVIMQMSDVHIGSPECAVATLIEHIKLIKKHAWLFALLVGDAGEFAISNRMLDAVLGQVAPPQEQSRVLMAIFYDLAEKLLALVKGNHDERDARYSGVDLWEFMIRSMTKRGHYMRDGGVLRYRMAGGIEYSHRIIHGDGLKGGSMYSETANLGRNARHEMGWCDIQSSGHTHTPEGVWDLQPRSDGRPKELTLKIRSGSYKTRGAEQYPTRMGFASGGPVYMPAVILFPYTKRMIGPFARVEDAVELCEALIARDTRKRA